MPRLFRLENIGKILALGLCLIIIFSVSAPVLAEPSSELMGRFSISLGTESLKYQERTSLWGFPIKSSARVNNPIVRIETAKKWRGIFYGIKIIHPIYPLKSKEEKWDWGGEPYQTNDLKYSWRRIDGFIELGLFEGVNFYGGIRRSDTKQEREHFMSYDGFPLELPKVTEKVGSWGYLFGFRGQGKVPPKWQFARYREWFPTSQHHRYDPNWTWFYGIEYFQSFDMLVTNSFVPGVKFRDVRGYGYGVELGLGYLLNKETTFKFSLHGGVMHWKGDEIEEIEWPENDTYYLGLNLNFTLRF